VRLALDTSAYVQLQRDAPDLAEEIRGAELIGVPIIVLGELRFGFVNGTRLHENTRILERFLAVPRVRVLGIDDHTTHLFGEIAALLRRAGTPIQQNDMWIAALCKQHDFVLATADRGFGHVLGLRVIAT